MVKKIEEVEYSHVTDSADLLAEQIKNLSDDELAKLIELPPRVFQELLQEFGRDEVIALIVNMVATSVTNSLQLGEILTVLSGPISEKIGLFLYPTLRQFLAQRHLSPEEKQTALQQIAEIWQVGRATLARDVLLHDPIYTILLLLELQNFPDVPVAFLSAIAFTIAIVLTVGTEIGGRELLHQLQLKQLERQGFIREEIYESRVLLRMQPAEAERVLKEIQTEFGFSEIVQANYRDTYYKSGSGQNGRKSKLRHRVRTEQEADGTEVEYASVQVLFEKLTKNNQGFFPTSKDKLRLYADDSKYQAYLQNLIDTMEPIGQIMCNRDYMHLDEVYVSFDRFSAGISEEQNAGTKEPYLTIEVKAHRNNPEAVRMQQEIIYFLTSKYPDKISETNKPKNSMLVD